MRGVKNTQVLVKLAIGCGIILGIVLLIQTIRTYFFVYDKVVRDQSAQEVERKEAALLRAATSAKVTDIHQFTPLLEELQRESPKEVAWIRIISLNGQVIAQVGTPESALPTTAELLQQLQMHRSRSELVKSPRGDILIVDSRLRFFGRPNDFHPPVNPERRLPFGPPTPPMGPGALGPTGPGPRDQGAIFSEIAIYVDGVTVNFGPLRRDLIIGCLGSVTLLASMLSIGLLFEKYIRARQLEQQLELARSVQTDLLPNSLIQKPSDNLDFAAVFLPAATIGGDFYDVFTSENAPISIVLGDVAGKGISAALLMGVLHGAIRSMLWTRSAADQEEASQWLNRFLCEKTARERFVSLFWAYFLPETNVLRYVNAGHLPPLLIRANGEKPSVVRLESGGPVLGLIPFATYASDAVHVEAGDVLVVFSDGVAEATNALDEEFGEVRIAEIVGKHIAESPRAICDVVLQEVGHFLGTMKPHDDQTLLIVRLVPTKKSAREADIRDSVSLANN